MIWRVLPSADGKLVGEERDLARKDAKFFLPEPDDRGGFVGGNLVWWTVVDRDGSNSP